MFFAVYYAVIFVFAGLLVAIETHSGGRCGMSTYDVWNKSNSIYELAFELSWTTVSVVDPVWQTELLAATLVGAIYFCVQHEMT